MAKKNVPQAATGEPCQAQKATRLFVKLVDPADAPAAFASAEVLAKFGVALVVFSDLKMMNGWLAGTRDIHGLSVRVLKDMEVAHV